MLCAEKNQRKREIELAGKTGGCDVYRGWALGRRLETAAVGPSFTFFLLHHWRTPKGAVLHSTDLPSRKLTNISYVEKQCFFSPTCYSFATVDDFLYAWPPTMHRVPIHVTRLIHTVFCQNRFIRTHGTWEINFILIYIFFIILFINYLSKGILYMNVKALIKEYF